MTIYLPPPLPLPPSIIRAFVLVQRGVRKFLVRKNHSGLRKKLRSNLDLLQSFGVMNPLLVSRESNPFSPIATTSRRTSMTVQEQGAVHYLGEEDLPLPTDTQIIHSLSHDDVISLNPSEGAEGREGGGGKGTEKGIRHLQRALSDREIVAMRNWATNRKPNGKGNGASRHQKTSTRSAFAFLGLGSGATREEIPEEMIGNGMLSPVMNPINTSSTHENRSSVSRTNQTDSPRMRPASIKFSSLRVSTSMDAGRKGEGGALAVDPTQIQLSNLSPRSESSFYVDLKKVVEEQERELHELRTELKILKGEKKKKKKKQKVDSPSPKEAKSRDKETNL